MNPVAYAPLDGLVDLACRDGVDIRPTLLRVLTDLYVQKPVHNAEEETQYVELALGLTDAVDAATRAAVAERLAAYPAAPAAVLARLNGAPAATAALPAAPPREDDLTDLFFMAGADERRLILTSLGAAAEPVLHPPAPASNEMLRLLEAAALQRNASEFARLLARALGIGQTVATRIVRDHSGEPVVIAAKALGMKATMLQRVLLFLNRQVGQSVERVYDLAGLFEDITPGAAAHMLAIWRRSAAPERAAHAPVHWDDAPRNARAGASSATHRDVRTADERLRARGG
jgi:uncharacterized protein (DUF2336 family)